MRNILVALLMLVLPFAAMSQAYTKGTKVQIKWGTTWYKGSIIDVKGEEYKVTYEGYASSWDEWVKADRLKLPGTAAAKPVVINPGQKPAIAKGTPENVPMGEYAVYQMNGGSFAYQYRFTLQSGGKYHEYDDDWGTYTYDAATKVLVFKTGPMEGYVGLYYTIRRNNDQHEPAIAIDFDGNVPDLATTSNGAYQYAYFRPDGVKQTLLILIEAVSKEN